MSIQRRGDSWRARYYGPDGRQRSKSFRRKSDAERWLTQQRSLLAQGDWTGPARGRITFGEYAPARLEGRTDLKPKTRHQYYSLLSLHILPTWRTVPLGKVTFDGLSQWVTGLSAGASALRSPAVGVRHVRRAGPCRPGRSHPRQRLSYQRHQRRAEHWFVVSGRPRYAAVGPANARAPCRGRVASDRCCCHQ